MSILKCNNLITSTLFLESDYEILITIKLLPSIVQYIKMGLCAWTLCLDITFFLNEQWIEYLVLLCRLCMFYFKIVELFIIRMSGQP